MHASGKRTGYSVPEGKNHVSILAHAVPLTKLPVEVLFPERFGGGHLPERQDERSE